MATLDEAVASGVAAVWPCWYRGRLWVVIGLFWSHLYLMNSDGETDYIDESEVEFD